MSSHQNRCTCFLEYFLEYLMLVFDGKDEESEQFSNSKISALWCCLAFV